MRDRPDPSTEAGGLGWRGAVTPARFGQGEMRSRAAAAVRSLAGETGSTRMLYTLAAAGAAPAGLAVITPVLAIGYLPCQSYPQGYVTSASKSQYDDRNNQFHIAENFRRTPGR